MGEDTNTPEQMNHKFSNQPLETQHGGKYVIIAAMPRGGSYFITGVMNRAGLRIGHEGPEDGGVAGYTALFPECEYHKKIMPVVYELEKQIVWLHQTRHPLPTIESMAAMMARSDWPHWGSPELWDVLRGKIAFHPMDNLVVCAMKLYLYLDTLVPEQTEFTYRVEDLPAAWDTICKLTGIENVALNDVLADKIFEDRFGLPINSHRDWAGYMPLSWELLEGLNPILTNALKELCDNYGYEIPR